MVSQTNIATNKDKTSILLFRRIGYRMVKIEFSLDVVGGDLIPYFAMNDDDFVRYTKIY